MTKKRRLPSELVDLYDRYQELVRAVEVGDLREQDAFEALAHISCADGRGAVWSLDADGQFLRRPNPFEPPEVTDPSEFVTVGGGYDDADGEVPLAARPGADGKDVWKESRTRPVRVGARERHLEIGDEVGSSTRRSGRSSGWWRSPTVVVGVVAVGLFLVALVSRPDRPVGESVEVVGAGRPVVDGGVVEGVPVDDVSAPASSSVVSTVVQSGEPSVEVSEGEIGSDDGSDVGESRSVPSLDEVVAVVAVLTSGSESEIESLIVDTGPSWRMVTGASTLRGLEPLGWSIEPGSFSVTSGAVEQFWLVVESTSGVERDRWKVRWVKAESGWKLAGWPAPSPR